PALAFAAFTVFAQSRDEAAAIDAVEPFMQAKPWMAGEFAGIARRFGFGSASLEQLGEYGAVLKGTPTLQLCGSRGGYDVICHGGVWYVVAMQETAKDMGWYQGRNWSSKLKSNSLAGAFAIAERLAVKAGKTSGEVRLVREGIAGFNIVACDG